MQPVHKIIIGAVAVLVVAGGVTFALTGFGSSSNDTHPPCDTLPTAAEVSNKLESNRKLADDIRAVGDGVSVEVGRPCDGDRALVQVAYDSADQRDAVRRVLSDGTGFGVPVHLVRR
ncbi:hypothetical protein ABZ816_15625 [Actinosynnema sp. NPDC047251]|uniref:Uncharacterized protein n=1 Tax=Saccharothrix espanaensis (strain ATCC 51144 / DSM 44229 / JCM 9112 / NBRC 15066 / NRRL 15764) TaxID=1179773 RepID=K0JUE7_SACES|nr:hypothetical protein [Saccharothrix espanaensis]CCH29551.1 hypothetical protein BN6_22300 [Saccharothrix espanaensis DSM 44229]